ncbi:MAG: UbiD family decarboxylase [Rhodospirillaceae bacterium]|nr:UbiD family decarboxylase [Rhodospirillaceae bacterium]MDD9924561.1 UbiD family decarboxylase [Rhodospirillaceae bacterium]
MGRAYKDLWEHIETLDEAGLLYRIDKPVNKDTEMHPLVRWQFRGGIPEAERKAFLFTNITDSKGRTYDMPVLIGGLAANPEIYRIGMGADRIEDIGPLWDRALRQPVETNLVESAPCQDIVLTGADIQGPGKGLDALPIPISTPGYDVGPYFTAATWITKDIDSSVQNMGVYRGNLKAPDRLAVMMQIASSAGGYHHWKGYQARGEKMPVCIILGCPPVVEYTGPQKVKMGVDELTVAGGLAGGPINIVKAKTVDLYVPAEAQVVVEGYVDPELLEPEGPFGESHGYVALEEYNFTMDVTAITQQRKPVVSSIISQVTPSESSVIKKVAFEPMFLSHLRDTLGIRGVQKVSLHEPLTNLRRFVSVTMDREASQTEIWRALTGVSSYQPAIGKYCIAINDDIDPDNADALLWAMSYRANPVKDIQIVNYRSRGHGPVLKEADNESTMLIDATLKYDLPPVALPKKEFMERAKDLWEELGLPPLEPESPWHGYSLGDWNDKWDAMAKRATDGDYLLNGERTGQLKQKLEDPQVSIRDVLGNDIVEDG